MAARGKGQEGMEIPLGADENPLGLHRDGDCNTVNLLNATELCPGKWSVL